MNILNLFNALPGAVAQGLIWGITAIGIYITFRILDIADLTVDGTMCTGGAVCIMMMLNGYSIGVSLAAAFAAGLLAGLVRRYVLEKSTLPRTALAFFPAALLGSVLWQSMALALVYGGEAKEAFFLAKLVSRGIQFALTASVDTLIVWLLLRRGALSGVQRHIQAKGGRKHDDP